MSKKDDAGIEPQGPFRLGDWLVEPSLNRLSRGSDIVQLEPRTMDLLVFFARHPDEVLSQATIIDAVWPQQFVAESVLRRTIATLREALGDDAKSPTYIDTISKRGYRLIAPVVEIEPDAAAEPVAPPVRTLAVRPVVWAAAVVVAALAVGAVLISTRSEPGPATASHPVDPPRVLVLPFDNLGAPDDEYFSDGMTAEILGRLAAVGELEVISRTSAMYYKGKDLQIRDIADDLGVDYVLEGTVQWDRSGEEGGRVRITPQLIRASDDSQLWGEQYDRVLEDIFEVQSDIATQVIDTLQVELLEPERLALEARPTDNMEAYHAYLRGLRYSVLPHQEDAKRATDMFERAVELDPDFALAHAHLSRIHTMAVGAGLVGGDRLSNAKRAADRALALDPDLPEAHLALAVFCDLLHSYDQMMRHSEKAAQLRPNDPNVLMAMAVAHDRHGRWQEHEALLERAAEIDPYDPGVLIFLANAYSYARKHQRAAQTIERAIAVAPDLASAYANRHDIYRRWYGPSPQSRRVLEETPSSIPDLDLNWINQEMDERKYEAALARLANAPDVMIWGTSKVWLECQCYIRMNQLDRGREACEPVRTVVESALAQGPDRAPSKGIALALLWFGRAEEAMREIERKVESYPSVYAHGAKDAIEKQARICAGSGELDAAMDRIEELLSMPGELTVARLRLEPRWDPLRDHPRFQEILERYDGEK